MAIVFATIGCCVAILVALLVSLNLLGYPVTLAEAIGYPFLFGFLISFAMLFLGRKRNG